VYNRAIANPILPVLAAKPIALAAHGPMGAASNSSKRKIRFLSDMERCDKSSSLTSLCNSTKGARHNTEGEDARISGGTDGDNRVAASQYFTKP
jgi:hypothetical protein